MEPRQTFSIAVPRSGERIDVVEFGGEKIVSAGPLASVKGPFRIAQHDCYECTTGRDTEILIFRLQRGEKMDAEERKIYDLLNGTLY